MRNTTLQPYFMSIDKVKKKQESVLNRFDSQLYILLHQTSRDALASQTEDLMFSLQSFVLLSISIVKSICLFVICDKKRGIDLVLELTKNSIFQTMGCVHSNLGTTSGKNI